MNNYKKLDKKAQPNKIFFTMKTYKIKSLEKSKLENKLMTFINNN